MSKSDRRDQAVECSRIGDGVRGAAAARERGSGRRTDHGGGAPVEEPAEGRLAERAGETVDRRRRGEGDDIDLAAGHRFETRGDRRGVDRRVGGAIGLDAHHVGAERGETGRECRGGAIAGGKEEALAGEPARRPAKLASSASP